MRITILAVGVIIYLLVYQIARYVVKHAPETHRFHIGWFAGLAAATLIALLHVLTWKAI